LFVHVLIALPFFNFDKMKGISFAAACLCNWVVNIVKYHKIYKKVAPLMVKVEEANETKRLADADHRVVQKRLRDVEEQCEALDQKLRTAVKEKENVEMEANQCQEKLELAERLVTNLADENERWTNDVASLNDLGIKLIIVLGHQGCGAVKAAQLPTKAIMGESPKLKDMLLDMKRTLAHCSDTLDRIEDPSARDRVAVIANAQAQVAKILEDPGVQKKVESGEVLVLPAFYEITSGIVDFIERPLVAKA